jgi:hypothetical protein
MQNIANQQRKDQETITNKTAEKLNALKSQYSDQIEFTFNFSFVAIVTICVFLSLFPLIDFLNFLSRRKSNQKIKNQLSQPKPVKTKPVKIKPSKTKPVDSKFKAKTKKVQSASKYLEIFKKL